ncbi:hypothetical protein ATERTT37_003200 [Aspergillus terreus]
MHVLIVGAGLGGLACAVSCRAAGLKTTILEQSPEITEVGAGIQIPPNATRVTEYLGLWPQVKEKGSRVEFLDILRYANGKLILRRPLGDDAVKELGGEWMVIHRADYQAILLAEAQRLGTEIRTSSRVISLDTENTRAILEDGSAVAADVIIGADGLWSTTRTTILDHPSPPSETGDLAYRATFTRESLVALGDSRINKLIQAQGVTLWAGPGGHSVFYPVRNGSLFNLVLLCPDNMPEGTRTTQGSVEEMREFFKDWDPNNIALLGDACHPTLPYQAQGAAMAVEDGALLGLLLGEYNKHPAASGKSISGVLALYESIRKPRTTLNVNGATNNRYFYHLPDGPEQAERDASFVDYDWISGDSKYSWANVKQQKDLLACDVLAEGRAAFKSWIDGPRL